MIHEISAGIGVFCTLSNIYDGAFYKKLWVLNTPLTDVSSILANPRKVN